MSVLNVMLRDTTNPSALRGYTIRRATTGLDTPGHDTTRHSGVRSHMMTLANPLRYRTERALAHTPSRYNTNRDLLSGLFGHIPSRALSLLVSPFPDISIRSGLIRATIRHLSQPYPTERPAGHWTSPYAPLRSNPIPAYSERDIAASLATGHDTSCQNPPMRHDTQRPLGHHNLSSRSDTGCNESIPAQPCLIALQGCPT